MNFDCCPFFLKLYSNLCFLFYYYFFLPFFKLFEWYIMFSFYPSLGIQSWYDFPVRSVSLYLFKSWHLFVFSCNSNSIVIHLFYNEFQTFSDQHVALFQNRRNSNVNDGETKYLSHCFSHHFTINFRYTISL